MSARLLDLNVDALACGSYLLTQHCSAGESAIEMHPCQIRWLAELAGLLTPAPAPTWPRGFWQRFARLRDRAAELIETILSVPGFPPGGGPDDDALAACALLDEFDGMRFDYFDTDGSECHENSPALPERNEKSAPISVTPVELPKRGRPASDGALSNTERQKRYRQRKKAESLRLDLEGKR